MSFLYFLDLNSGRMNKMVELASEVLIGNHLFCNCSTLGGSHGVPRVHYKGRQGDYYVMVSKEERVKSLTLQLVLFLCCRLQCTECYLTVGIGF